MDTERFWCEKCESVQLADGLHECECPDCGAINCDTNH